MPFTVSVHPTPTHLLVQASGPARLAEACGYVDLAGTVAARRGYTRLLLDVLDVELDMSFTDHLQLGTYAAERLQGLDRVASVVAARFRTGVSEKAAQKSGLTLRTFTELAPALAWLAAEHA